MSRKKCKHDPRVRFDFPPIEIEIAHLTLIFLILYALHTLTLLTKVSKQFVAKKQNNCQDPKQTLQLHWSYVEKNLLGNSIFI